MVQTQKVFERRKTLWNLEVEKQTVKVDLESKVLCATQEKCSTGMLM